MSDEQQTPNTSSSNANEINIGGNVTTGRDFIGRDLTVQGDQVQGDKITAGDRGVALGQVTGSSIVTGHSNIIGDGNTVITQRLDPTDARNQRNHATMRQLVRKFWIDGVLKSSLYNEALIRLNLTEQPKAVDNRPWDLILQQPGQPNYALPVGTPIIDVFDQMNQRLLILGEPGSGKTTTLLELADALLKRAETDPTHPTPVVFNLSSWAEKRQALAEWLVDELLIKYNIPMKVAQKWMENDEIMPFLDGLDEVKQEYRSACVNFINKFQQEHLVSVVVCSRTTEYDNLTTRLRLQGAVQVQPLSIIQIDQYLGAIGGELSAVRATLQQDIELQEMARTPLLLSIMVIAYHAIPEIDLSLDGMLYSRRQHLFDTYLKRMFSHREKRYSYPTWKTLYWLSWLAKNMYQRQQTIFLIERLQVDWLQDKLSERRTLASRIVGEIKPIERYNWSFKSAMILGLSTGVIFAIGGATFGILTDRYYWSLFAGAYGGLIYGLLGGFYNVEPPTLSKTVIGNCIRQGVRSVLFTSLYFGLIAFLFGHVYDGLILGSAIGLANGISLGLFWDMRDKPRELASAITTTPNFGIYQSARYALLYALCCGLVGFLLDIISNGKLSQIYNEFVNILVDSRLNDASVYFVDKSNSLLISRDYLLRLMPNYIVELLPVFSPAHNAKLQKDIHSFINKWLLFGGFTGGISWLLGGGEAVVKHLSLRFLLWYKGFMPWNFAHFLDYCHDRIFLRKVGGGYIFIHRMLMEHFASLTDEDIKRIVADVEASK